ncbi:gluconate 2-dehydrogenase subunit 3 family protein [Algiphilus sp.]|uniref:gluconate 2-dehydrogenase subunit 3 family protein n=1 Tax=Algiphilus sp. TaxID=1872431 RepID=UPI003BAAC81F
MGTDPTSGAPEDERPRSLSRRVVLQCGGAVCMQAWLLPMAGCGTSTAPAAQQSAALRGPERATPLARFLTDAERATLRGLVDRLIPSDLTPGAAVAEAENAIDAFLAAFLTDPPLIYAGGPFSDRAGATDNDFERFIPLDAYEQLAWRLVIEGSQALPEREFNGPVKGLQQIYREGLARLDARAQQLATGILPAALGDIVAAQLADTGLEAVLAQINALAGNEGFADLPAPLRDLILFDTSDATVQALVDVAFPDTLAGTYGPPEYGGNRDLVGWTLTDFDGDVQPRGYSDDAVVNADNPGPFDSLLPPSYGRDAVSASATAKSEAPQTGVAEAVTLPLVIAPSESLAAIILDAGGSLAALKRRLEPWANAPSDAIWTWSADHA